MLVNYKSTRMYSVWFGWFEAWMDKQSVRVFEYVY
jgi:hypothetical protein